MTIEHMGPFLECGLFPGTRGWTMAVLCNYSDDNGECFPSHEAIAIAARCKRETVLRQIDWLSDRGCIEVLKGAAKPAEMRKISRRANVYRINLGLVRAMYNLIREVKSLSGRDPKKRYAAVALIAKWAEGVIEKDGAETVIAASAELIATGDLVTLLKKSNSDDKSQDNASTCDIDEEKCDDRSPKPSSEPSSEPSGDNRKSCEEKGNENAQAEPAEDREAKKAKNAAAQRIIMDWVRDGEFGWVRAHPFTIPREGLHGQAAREFVFSLEGAGFNHAVSLLRWATYVEDGTDDGTPIIADVRALLAWRAETLTGETVKKRCAALIEEHAKRPAKAASESEDPENSDEKAA